MSFNKYNNNKRGIIMKTTMNSIKKVFCVAAIFSTLGLSLFASPKTEKTQQKEISIEKPSVSVPKTAELRTIRGKIKVKKVDGKKVLSYTSLSDNKYSVVLVDEDIEDDLIKLKNKKINLSGYLDNETKTFYVIKIGHVSSSSKDYSDAK